jgi:hypothetical protein
MSRYISYSGKVRSAANRSKTGFRNRIIFLISGFFALLWFLVRVIPKPSRVNYPCIKATMPLAYSFMAYILSITGSIVFFRKAYKRLRERQVLYAAFGLAMAGLFGTWALINTYPDVKAITGPEDKFEDPLGPNLPIGEAKGIFPGRVVWAWDPDATNENVTSLTQADAYWLTTSTSQDKVDQMFSEGIKALTGEGADEAAWDAIFRYFNVSHGKEDTGYLADETIFIKINAVTAHGGAWPDGDMSSGRAVEYDTSPQAILAMLRQLVNKAGVPEGNIYIGDPIADIYNHIYEYLYAEFPDVKYCTQYGIPDRYDLTPSSQVGIHFSDGGSVMSSGSNNNKFFTEMMNADYLLNIPTMKGHAWGGVTFFAKNHFGSNTYNGSWYMHPGLVNNDDHGMRTDYRMYRVLVDLMSCKYLGGNTLLYFMDALWSTSYEHQPPQKFQTAPFNNDWCSSLMFSLDPVAIESVCLDILQKEFTTEDQSVNPDRCVYVQYGAVDDYLHQAASSEWWPDGITYDPDNTGSGIESQGVHEHWNNTTQMKYSRDLGTGEGIELVKLFYGEYDALENEYAGRDLSIFPNPVVNELNADIVLDRDAVFTAEIVNLNGQVVRSEEYELRAGEQILSIKVENLNTGTYILFLRGTGPDNYMTAARKFSKK